MIGIFSRQPLALALCFLLALATTPAPVEGAAIFQAASTVTSPDYAGQGTPYTEEQLQNMVAPIALYPDALIAQILNAATFPDQVAVAANWLQQNSGLTGSALVSAANNQAWDPSVKALTQFPTVLNNMSQNLAWTSQLGEAYHNQEAEVMSAIQAMRARAQAAGNLKTTSQMQVVQAPNDNIIIQPENPGVVYLPVYNPALIYGAPVVVPNYSTADLVATGVLSFGAGIAVGALASSDWGWNSWSCNWAHGGAYYRGYPYYGNNAWHGGYYGGYNYYGNHNYNSSYDYNHPYNAYQSASYHSDSNLSAASHTAQTSTSANVTHGADAESWNKAAGGWSNADDARGWGQSETHQNSTAFSSWGNHSASSSYATGGWGDRSASSRGWASHGGTGGGWGSAGRTGDFRR